MFRTPQLKVTHYTVEEGGVWFKCDAQDEITWEFVALKFEDGTIFDRLLLEEMKAGNAKSCVLFKEVGNG